jgi:hypothetical protein
MNTLLADGVRAFDVVPPSPRPVPVKDWTVMVYMNGKNNLEPFGLKDLNEMESAGSTDRVNVVAQLGRIAGYSSEDGDWKTVRRYLVKKDSQPAKVTSPVLQEFQRLDMGDYRSLAEFGSWVKENYPARHYMLIVWNHGSGWKRARAAGRGISYDDETGNHITVAQLAGVLRGIGGTDIYASDACLMQMAEVAWELKDSAPYIIGSEETEPVDGYSYGPFLSELAARPDMGPEELSAAVANAYSNYYSGNDTGSTISYLRASALPELARAADGLVSELMAKGARQLALDAARGAKSYAYPDNRDMYDFAVRVERGASDDVIRAAARRLAAVIKERVVAYNRTTNSTGGPWGANPVDHTNSNGLAVHLPTVPVAEGYAGLRWAADSRWDEFLGWLSGK